VVEVVKVVDAFKNKRLYLNEMEFTGVDRRKNLKNLLVYQRIMELVKLVYELTSTLPKSEEYGLKSQMRRAAVSILANFSEGYMRHTTADKLRFLEIADTSRDEIDAEADVCHELKYWNDLAWSRYLKLSSEVSYLMYRYSSKIPRKN
jgi:four helix bundle protein